MSATAKVVRKIPIRSVSRVNNNNSTASQPEQQQTTSSTTSTEKTNIQSNQITTTNDSSSRSLSTQSSTTTTIQSSDPSPIESMNIHSTPLTAQHQTTSTLKLSTREEEEDVYNPKINYDSIEKQSLKLQKFCKALIISKKKEQVRFYLPKVEQLVPQQDLNNSYSIVPISICILYHRQNGGEYALCIFKDQKLLDLCPLVREKTEISLISNPLFGSSHKQRTIIKLESENLSEMSVEYNFQCDSEMQLLSVYSAIDKALLYNGFDSKQSRPTFNSLIITYSSRQMKEPTTPKQPVPFVWCSKYVEAYSSNVILKESFRTEKKKHQQLRKTEEHDSSSDSSFSSSFGRNAMYSQDNVSSPIDEPRRRFIEEHEDALGSRHFIPSGDDTSDSDAVSGRRRHRDALIQKSSPILSSPIAERKREEEYEPLKHRGVIYNSDDGDTSPLPQQQQKTEIVDTSPTSSSPTGKKVIKRVVKRVPAKTE